MSLTIIISALGKNLYKIDNWISSDILNAVNEIIIVVQKPENFEPEIKKLKNIGCKVFIDNQLGLSRSRNIGIRNCKSDFFWILDDDIYTNLNMIESILDQIKFNQADIYTFRIAKDKTGNIMYKKYSNNPKVSKLRLLQTSSIELIVSKKIINKYNIFFNENFGLGSKYPMCEENLFLLDYYQKNIKIIHIPKVIVVHEDIGSGYAPINNNSLIAKGYVCQKFGLIGLLVILRWYFRIIIKYQKFSSIRYFLKGYLIKKI